MEPVMVRTIRPGEIEQASLMLDASGRFFPHDVFTLPLTRLLVAERREGGYLRPILLQPLYPSLSLGSFVPYPDATAGEIASALSATTREAYSRANEWGMAELLVSTEHDRTTAFALRHGFAKAHTTYRMEVR